MGSLRTTYYILQLCVCVYVCMCLDHVLRLMWSYFLPSVLFTSIRFHTIQNSPITLPHLLLFLLLVKIYSYDLFFLCTCIDTYLHSHTLPQIFLCVPCPPSSTPTLLPSKHRTLKPRSTSKYIV